MTTTDRPGTLAEALATLQTRLPRIGKDKTAKVKGKTKQGADFEYSYNYADLVSVSEAVLPLLGDLGLSFISMPTLRDDGRLVLAYELMHSSGGSKGGSFPLQMARDKEPTPQEIGSLITYARRYCLCAVTGAAADDDDDGHAADAAAARKPRPSTRRRTAIPDEYQTTAEEKVAHNMLRPHRSDNDPAKSQRLRPSAPDPDDPWLAVDRNGERQPAAELPHTYPAGERQVGRLQGHFKRLGFTDDDRAERLHAAAALAGADRPITSLNDLTQDEVKQAIREIEVLPNGDRGALVERLIAIKEAQVAAP